MLKKIAKLLRLLIIASIFVGCVTTQSMSPPLKYNDDLLSNRQNNEKSPPQKQSCNFESIDGTTYVIKGEKKYVGGYFVTHPNYAESYTYKQNLSPLYNKRIKIIDNKIKKEIKYGFQSRYFIIEGDEGAVSYFTRGFTKLVTEDCNIYYLKKDTPGKLLVSYFGKTDGSELGMKDKVSILGGGVALDNSELSVREDKFEGTKWLSTPVISNVILRALLDLDTGQLKFIQIYANTLHIGEWAFLDRAKDKHRNDMNIVKIDTDVDCSSKYSGCRLTETVGITIDPSYLEGNREGIIIQASGKGGKSLIYVPSEVIDLMLRGLQLHTKKT